MGNANKEPKWLSIARRFLGTREVKGPAHSPVIIGWLVKLGAWWRDDETPWCGVFAGAVLKEAGLAIPSAYYRAKAWEAWGSPLAAPVVGCIVTFTREGGGHVGFVVGQDQAGRLQVLGGNQGDAVTIATFDRGRVTSYRWPMGVPVGAGLPVLAAAAVSRSEA
jgi:uncharacterized protein (TIGR02594 family)